jgi:hypothetical protein
LLAAADDLSIRHLIQSIVERGTFLMVYEAKICKQADVSFGPVGLPLPLVGEVS